MLNRQRTMYMLYGFSKKNISVISVSHIQKEGYNMYEYMIGDILPDVFVVLL